VKPSLLEKKLAENPEFQQLPEGFKRIFAEDKKDQDMHLPVVGYSGHRKGYVAENMFAKNFRETSITSTKVLRHGLQNTRSNYLK